MGDDGPGYGRRAWRAGPEADAAGLLALDDDDLLHRIQSLPPDHRMDEPLLGIVRSNRHFFIRQEAAKRVKDARKLMDYAQDRHVGQILVRRMSRAEDAGYLEVLAKHSLHLDVRKAAQAQLERLRNRRPVHPFDLELPLAGATPES
jgi:hypothetical protein